MFPLCLDNTRRVVILLPWSQNSFTDKAIYLADRVAAFNGLLEHSIVYNSCCNQARLLLTLDSVNEASLPCFAALYVDSKSH